MLKELLDKLDMTLSVAESLTGGKLSATICNEHGISKFYKGSVTSYTCEIKNKVLGVDKDMLDLYGPYNFNTTHQMCDGVMKLMDSDIAVATSGVAGPGPDGDTPEGLFYITVKVKDRYYDLMWQSNLHSREEIRESAMLFAYKYLLEVLQKRTKDGECDEQIIG